MGWRNRKRSSGSNQDICKSSCQTHVHEFLGSTRIAEQQEDPHNHRFAGVTSEVIPLKCGCCHKHAILTNTDFYEDHHHEIGVETGPNIELGNGKHVHLVKGMTTVDECHSHTFIFATLIQDPISEC